jgi:hypothetical protein
MSGLLSDVIILCHNKHMPSMLLKSNMNGCYESMRKYEYDMSIIIRKLILLLSIKGLDFIID